MAYVTPTTRADGYVVEAAEWNKNTVDNPIALRTGALAIASQATGDVITASTATQLTLVSPGTAGHALISNGAGVAPSFQAVAVSAIITPTVIDLVDGATPALDASAGTVFRLTAAGNRTIAVPSNPTAGQKIVIRHVASGADRTLALNTGAGGFRFGTDITGLTATTSGKTDYIGCIYDATAGFFDVVAYSKGY